MGLESVAATVYAYWSSYMARSMLGAWDDVKANDRCKMYEGTYRLFTLENLNLILRKASEGDTYYNPLCKSPKTDYTKGQYKGDNICAYNAAESLYKAKKFLTENISADSNNWKWGDIITTRFKNTPWSYVEPLKPYFDRYVVIPGNGNTLWVAEYGICGIVDEPDPEDEGKPIKIEAGKVTSYAHILTFEPDRLSPEKNTYGVTGGLNEFPLQGNYDDGTAVVLSGNMWQMKHPQDIEDGLVLKLKPKED